MTIAATMAQNLCVNHFLRSSTRRTSSNAPLVPFARIARATPTEEISLEKAYLEDKCTKKVTFGRNIYQDNEGKPFVFPAVRQAEIGIACDDFLKHDPMPTLGNEEFTKAASELILGASSPALLENRVFGIQTRNCVDALCFAAQFLRHKMNYDACLLARPSWHLYEHIFKSLGFTCNSYMYNDTMKAELNIYGLVADLMSAPEGAVVVLDACAHNPTGIDPTIDEWKLIGHIMKCKKMLPLFVLDAQGLVSGDLAQDAWPVRFFVDCGFDMFCAQSFVKNFGLYNETVGNLLVVLSNPVHMDSVKSQFEFMMLNSNEENSLIYASRIVAKILNSETLRKEWVTTLKDMQKRLESIRTSFVNRMQELKVPGNWKDISEQKGMFAMTNLKRWDIDALKKKHIYVPKSGRINIAALNKNNLDYVANTISNVIQSKTNNHCEFYSDHIAALHHYFNSP